MNKDNLLLLLKDKTIRKEILNIVRPKLLTTKSISTKKILEIEPNGGAVNTNELAILRLVFKWKVLPVSIIKGCLRKNESMDTFRRRVNRLIERGLLKRVVYIGRLTLIQLTEYGFTRMKNGIDGFKEDGFSSEALWHDFLSAALQLGPLAPLKSKNFEIVTEQEMRRFFKRDLPSWLPDIDSHRPDGFSKFKFKDRNKILAYEVEISTKSPDRYDSVAQYYARLVQVECVVWLVKNSAAVDTIQKSLLRYGPVRVVITKRLRLMPQMR